jgi:hypothetical protein
MAEKLSESSWTGFKNKQKLDLNDAPLVKALAAFDKTRESEPEPRLKALDELVTQIPEQVKALIKRKKELGDKPFGEAKDNGRGQGQEAQGAGVGADPMWNSLRRAGTGTTPDKQKALQVIDSQGLLRCWWRFRDSNPGPADYDSVALTN